MHLHSLLGGKRALSKRALSGASIVAGVTFACCVQALAAAPQPTDATSQRQEAAVEPSAKKGPVALFDGHTLAGWKVTDFGGQGKVLVRDGRLVLEDGSPLTGITWTRPFPTSNYEVSLDAMRVDGIDFFCGMTFPVGNEFCSLIVGGWAGTVVGLSSINGSDASENETTDYMRFEKGRWYRIRLRVTDDRIEAWIDKEKFVDVPREDRSFSVRIEVDRSRPFGIASFLTTAALRNVTLEKLAPRD